MPKQLNSLTSPLLSHGCLGSLANHTTPAKAARCHLNVLRAPRPQAPEPEHVSPAKNLSLVKNASPVKNEPSSPSPDEVPPAQLDPYTQQDCENYAEKKPMKRLLELHVQNRYALACSLQDLEDDDGADTEMVVDLTDDDLRNKLKALAPLCC